ncbi:hypothetical protein TW74_09545 [Vibrio nigripulchritudo]|nr:hypothetical protein TW74_09545 [Vibrio nigripulchritudo]
MAALPFPFVAIAMRKFMKGDVSDQEAPGQLLMGWMIAHLLALIVCLAFGGFGVYFTFSFLIAIGYSALYAVTKIIKQFFNRDHSLSNNVKTDHVPRPDELLTDRRVMALYKLAQQILDDDKVDLEEAKKLKAWFKRYPESAGDYRTGHLFGLVEEVLADEEIDDIEALDLFVGFSEFCDQYEADRERQGKAQLGQVQKPSFDHPQLRPLKDIELNKVYYMEYQDYAGDLSERNIVLKSVKVTKDNNPVISAFCQLRNASRTFRVDRIQTLYSPETGESFV